VTRDNGFVPSMSVTWKEIGNALTALTSRATHDDSHAVGAPRRPDAGVRETGLARLQDEFRTHQQPTDQ
jgi:hypothetical protein